MNLIGNVQLVAGGEDSVPGILALLRNEGWDVEGNPDIDIRVYPQFRVEDARQLCERSATRAVTDARRVFIIVTPNLTYEAQNTMLKTLEEPAGNALFFFVVPAPDALMPTVRSRSQMLRVDVVVSSEPLGMKLTAPSPAVHTYPDAGLFLRSSPQKRLDIIKPLLEKGDDDVRDISSIIMFLSSLERMLIGRAQAARSGIDAVYRARKYATDKGSMLKPLLEQVALLTPVLPS
ncbi:hypothetical protein K8R03_01745 [Candidatus Kaiserbacteria bacterium]|nr:hypothetical protein [Candidatus Kaiserbacteria bacterium]